MVAVEAGKEQELKQIMGIVDNWDAKSGKLVFMEDKIRHEVLLDPGNMRVMINSLKVKGRDLMVTENNGLRWENAFCVGDMIVVRTDEDNQPVFLMNNGYRSCGFKGE